MVPVIVALCAWLMSATYDPDPKAQFGFVYTLILFIIVFVLNELLRPKPRIENARPSGKGDFNFPTATQDRPVPVLFGRVRIDGPNILDFNSLDQVPIRDSVKTNIFGGKKRFVKGHKYYAGVQWGLCRGPNVELLNVRTKDGKELFSGSLTTDGARFDVNEPTIFGGVENGNGGIVASFDFYTGSLTQDVSPFLNVAGRQIISGVTTSAPRYVGTSHVVMREHTEADPLATDNGAYIGNTNTLAPLQFEVQRWSPLFAGQTAGQNIIDGQDSNPANVLFELLTNTEWGFGFLEADIDTGAGSTFLSASDTFISETHGFSYLLDRTTEAVEILREIERQVDGIIFLSQTTGKWSLKLARDDYVLASIPLADESNCEVESNTNGSWEDTTNHISVGYTKRDDEYKDDFAIAQDVGNMLIRGAGTVTTAKVVSATARFPGVKTRELASKIAWRLLTSQSYPLVRGVFKMHRSFWQLTPASVFKWTSAELGFSELPMRVTSINFGTQKDERITVQAVQDIFESAVSSFGVPALTRWTEADFAVTAYPSDEQFAFEIPRAILVRDPDNGFGQTTSSRVFCAAQRQTIETNFQIKQRNSSGTPSGSFADAGDSFAFIRVGLLDADLSAGTAVPTTTIDLKEGSNTLEQLLELFTAGSTSIDLGEDLVNLIKVGNEFMLVESAAIVGSVVRMTNVYRGVLDSVQEDHLEDDEVLLLMGGGDLATPTFPGTYNVHIKLLPESRSDVLAIGSATQIALTMNKRPLRPYPPSAPEFNSSGVGYGTPSLEGAGGPGLNDYRLDVGWWRRKFDTSDEVLELASDQTDVDASTEYEVELRYSPFTGSDVVATSTWATGNGPEAFNRNDILVASGMAAGSDLEVHIKSRHDHEGEVNIESLYSLVYRFTPTSSLSAQFFMGTDTWSNALTAYTAGSTGTYTVNLGVGYASTSVSYRINGGSWTVAIAAGGGTSGNITGVTASDTIEVRHDASEGGNNFVDLKDPGATSVAYGVFES